MLAKHTSRLLNKTIKTLSINNAFKRIIYHNPTNESNKLFMYPLRNNRIWIKQNEPPEWEYKDQQDLANVELVNALDKLKPGQPAPPFIILDVREEHERDIMDLPKFNKVRYFRK